ncbi:MAG: hypothetical protein KAX50_07460, partial [Saprospiraceae bacterium]|nr:hypothetical protein [Saprospiraceae bacterium]
MRKLLPIIWVMLCALPMSVSAQQIFIWEGATSSDWNVGANWLTFGPGVYPNTPTDIVLIIPAVNNPQLFVSDITVGNIIATFGASVDLNDFTLTIGGGNITGATVSDGRIVQVGSSALNFSGSTLSDITFDKSSSSVTNFQNGNTINFAPANHFRMLPGAGSIQLGVGTGDTFTGNARFINNSNSILTIGFEGASIFDGDVILEQNTPLGEIIFGAGAGTSTLANGYIDGTAIHDGTLYLGGIIQQNVGVSSIIGSAMMGYPHTLDIENSEFAGDLVAISLGTLSVMNTKMEGLGNYLEAPEITEIKQSVFVNTAIKKNITALASDVWFGGNKYDNCTVVNESSFDIRLNA